MMSIFRTRQLIDALLPLLKTIEGHILENEEACGLKEKQIREFQGDITELQKIMYIPRIHAEIEYFKNPRIICKSEKCTMRTKVEVEYEPLRDQICYEAETSVWTNLKGLLDAHPLVRGPKVAGKIVHHFNISTVDTANSLRYQFTISHAWFK